LGSSRFARRYSGNRFFFLFLQVLRCFSSLGLPSRRYVFTSRYYAIKRSGFPHSEISGSKLTYSSPKHIGVSAVLLRLLVPRHSPCALNNLTKLLSLKNLILKNKCVCYNFNVVLSSFQRTSFEVIHLNDEPSKLNAKRNLTNPRFVFRKYP